MHKYILSFAQDGELGVLTSQLHVDGESSVHSSAARGNFTSGRRPLGSSSLVLKVPIELS